MRAIFLAALVALGLAACTDIGLQPDNADRNATEIYTGAGGGAE